VGQIAVFTAVTVPYVVLLTLFGLPFNHSLFWLYVLPPGLLTWLATRPVLESKRLPELLISQARYLGQPSTWCRMSPLAEQDPAGPPRDEQVRQAAEVRESRWARAGGASRRTPARGRAGGPDAGRAPDSGWSPDAGRAPGQAGEAQGTPAAGAGWARDATMGT